MVRLHRYLIHNCMIERLTLTRGDAGEDVDTWSDWSSFRCRLLEESQAVADPALGQPVQYDYRLGLDPDLGILLTDRVKYVTLETDHVLTGPFKIVQIITKRRKKGELTLLSLERVTEES